MSLVEEYYELNEAEGVSAVWKVFQLMFYGCAGSLGVSCGFTLANLRSIFGNRCYLFTEVKASQNYDSVIHKNINWESDTRCDYYQFSMVSSFVVAVIWGTLYLMCGKGGKSLTGLPQPWRIVWPSLIFNLIYFIAMLFTAITIQQGTDQFCGRPGFNNKNYSKSLIENCKVLKVLLQKDLYSAAFQLEVVVKTSWGCVLSWFILFLLPLFRIVLVVDFRLYKICVFKLDDTIQNKREEVLKITNYEEPKKVYLDKDDDKINFESEDFSPDLEAGTKRKVKVDKKLMRHNVNIVNRTPLKPNAVFYETADIRMLNREKKKRNSYRALDDAFGKNKFNFGADLGKSIKMLSDPDVSSYSEISTYRYYRGINSDEDVDNSSSISKDKKPDFNKNGSESPGSSAVFAYDFHSNRFLRVKKQI